MPHNNNVENNMKGKNNSSKVEKKSQESSRRRSESNAYIQRQHTYSYSRQRSVTMKVKLQGQTKARLEKCVFGSFLQSTDSAGLVTGGVYSIVWVLRLSSPFVSSFVRGITKRLWLDDRRGRLAMSGVSSPEM